MRVVQRNIRESNAVQLLLIHAISGCDTTSAMYDLGKSTAFIQFDRHPETLELNRVLCSLTVNCEQVAYAGQKLLVLLYQRCTTFLGQGPYCTIFRALEGQDKIIS